MRDALRRRIRREIANLFGSGNEPVDLDTPAGDPGLFGPSSMAWRVHADLGPMMVGGIAALLLQMLHPAALAGVWDHSHFRKDRTGRLRRTAQFIAGTTYGGTAEAERLMAKVRAVHTHVRGTMPDGTAYRADDSDLLLWVHVAESWCLLEAYRRYRAPLLTRTQADRYHGEVAMIADRLGSAPAPSTHDGARLYLESMRPQLRYDLRTREVADALLTRRPGDLAAPLSRIVVDAAVDILPRWAAHMHGFYLGPRRHIARAGMSGMGVLLHWTLDDSSAAHAQRRVARRPLHPIAKKTPPE
ncbi:oxygenase MpaB family protein [Sphingobium olei]